MSNKRWYDAYPDLSILFEKMKNIDKEKRENILTKIKDLIIEIEPHLIDDNVLSFPMNQKRRWYDKDPYSWLIINSLEYATIELINKVTELIDKEFKS